MEFPVSVALLIYLSKSACDLTVPFVTAVVVVVAFVVAQSSLAASVLSFELFG